jgi:hypothetical protein
LSLGLALLLSKIENVKPNPQFQACLAVPACLDKRIRWLLLTLSSVLKPSSIGMFYSINPTIVMSKRLDLRLPDEDIALLEAYCKATGATNTGTVRMLLQILKDEHLLAIVRKMLTVD